MIKNIILDVGKVLVAWEPEDAMKQLGFDDKTVKVVADATVNTPVWLETDRGVWSDEQILQAFYEKAPEYKKEIDLFWNHLELAMYVMQIYHSCLRWCDLHLLRPENG
jgi:putative hydrolase of the HAD superfamily